MNRPARNIPGSSQGSGAVYSFSRMTSSRRFVFPDSLDEPIKIFMVRKLVDPSLTGVQRHYDSILEIAPSSFTVIRSRAAFFLKKLIASSLVRNLITDSTFEGLSLASV